MTSPENAGCQIGSFVFMLIAFVSFLTAFSTTHWMHVESTDYGLWRACSGDICTKIIGKDLTTTAFISAQVLFCVALILASISVAGHIAWVMLGIELTCFIAWAGQIASSLCSGLALILWGNESFRYFGGNYLSWSYWLMMFSSFLMAFGGGIVGCKTACATRMERGKPLVYSSSAAMRGMGMEGYPPHDTSDYSDMTQSDYSMANMAPQGRPLPPRPGGQDGWNKERGYGVGKTGAPPRYGDYRY